MRTVIGVMGGAIVDDDLLEQAGQLGRRAGREPVAVFIEELLPDLAEPECRGLNVLGHGRAGLGRSPKWRSR